MMKYILLFLCGFLADAQTFVRSKQIKNWNQVNLNSLFRGMDTSFYKPGTVPIRQLTSVLISADFSQTTTCSHAALACLVYPAGFANCALDIRGVMACTLFNGVNIQILYSITNNVSYASYGFPICSPTLTANCTSY